MRVSVCFVTRNHAAALPQALASVAGIAAERVVVDTGSTDDTVAAAQAAGATVRAVAWADDFAAACNTALDTATGDWVLWLNPDELLEPAAASFLESGVRDDRVFAYALTIRHQLRADRPDGLSEDIQPRLFRRTPEVRYRGRLHPDFDPPLSELANRAGQALVYAPTGAAVRRLAYLSPVTPDKIRWTNRLIEAELADRPDRLDLQVELGRNLLQLNDPRGHEVLGRAAGRMPTGGDRPPFSTAGQLLEYALTADPAAVRGPIDRAVARELADRWYPVTPPVVWAVAAERFQCGDYAAAAHQLRRLLEMGRTGLYDRSAAFDPDLVGPLAALNLAAALGRLGRTEEARAVLMPLSAHPDYRERAAAAFRALGS